jgi:hypothetical protein
MLKSKNTTKRQSRKAEASRQLITKWAETVCMSGDDAKGKTDAFLLLVDEIERAQFDRIRVEDICYQARRAAFAVSDRAYDAAREYTNQLRTKHGLSLVEKAS